MAPPTRRLCARGSWRAAWASMRRCLKRTRRVAPRRTYRHADRSCAPHTCTRKRGATSPRRRGRASARPWEVVGPDKPCALAPRPCVPLTRLRRRFAGGHGHTAVSDAAGPAGPAHPRGGPATQAAGCPGAHVSAATAMHKARGCAWSRCGIGESRDEAHGAWLCAQRLRRHAWVSAAREACAAQARAHVWGIGGT